MAKHLTIMAVLLLFGGCGEATSDPKSGLITEGKFLVSQKGLPPQVVELARSLERLSAVRTESEVEPAVAMCGLNKKSDAYSNGVHRWYLNQELESESDPQNRMYRVSISHISRPNSEVRFYSASIDKIDSREPQRRTIWHIDWPTDQVE